MAIFSLYDTHRYHVYAMLCQDGDGPGYVKFGRSRRIGDRLRQLRQACPIPARYFAVAEMPGERLMGEVERGLHQQFKDRRVTGEWFRFDFSSKEDKQAFNEGCKFVFSTILKDPVWWTKISVKALDEHYQEQRKKFLKSKHQKQIKQKHEYQRRVRKAHKELSQYGY